MYLPPPECEACRSPIDPTPGPIGQGRWCGLCAPAVNPMHADVLAALFPSWFGVANTGSLAMLLDHFRQARRVLQSLITQCDRARALAWSSLSAAGDAHQRLKDLHGQCRAQGRHVDFLEHALVSAVLA